MFLINCCYKGNKKNNRFSLCFAFLTLKIILYANNFLTFANSY